MLTPTIHPLAPPEPRDPISIRPPLDLPHVIRQVNGIQTFLAGERARKEALRILEKGIA